MKLPNCDVCGKPVDLERGALAVADHEASTRVRVIAASRQEYIYFPPGDSKGLNVITPEMMRQVPSPLAWTWGHVQCVQDRGYCIAASRLDSAEKALWWTRHLSSRGWFEGTDWWPALERLHDFPTAV